MTFNPVTFVLTTLIAFLLVVSPVNAFTGKEKIPELKNDVHIPKEAFEAKTTLINETPLQNKDFAFHVRLPKGWVKLNVEAEKEGEGTDIFRQLSAYTSPPRIEQRSIFRIRAIDLSSLITVDDWFIAYMLQMGFSVEGMTIKSPRKMIVQYTLFEDGEPYVTRAVVTMSGQKIILAEYLVHQDAYEAERDEQIWAMAGFDMDTPNESLPIVMKTFSFVDIAKFDYPANWVTYTPGITEINRMDASVINAINTHVITSSGAEITDLQMAGRIDVSVVSKVLGTSIGDEIKVLNKSLKDKNYKLGKFIETVDNVKLNPLIKNGRIDVYEMESLTQKLAGYEYWVAVLQTNSRYYLVRLITISRGENFIMWAQNVETYRVLLRSLSPASGQSAY